MQIETLNQAIKTLESVRGALGSFAKAEVDLTLGLLRREAEQPAQQQEPVKYSGNGTAGFSDAKAEGFFFQIPKAQQQQEPVAFPNRYLVEREIERSVNHKGMHLNDAKERVTLPSGTLRFMLALIDRTSPQSKPWVGLTLEEIDIEWGLFMSGQGSGYIPDFVHAIEARLKEKNA